MSPIRFDHTDCGHPAAAPTVDLADVIATATMVAVATCQPFKFGYNGRVWTAWPDETVTEPANARLTAPPLTIDPRVRRGMVCLSGTRITASDIFDILRGQTSPSQWMHDLDIDPVRRDDILVACAYRIKSDQTILADMPREERGEWLNWAINVWNTAERDDGGLLPLPPGAVE